VARSRCIRDFVAGLRLLGYQADYVSSDRVTVREADAPRGGRFAPRGSCTHQVILLALLAATRLPPTRRLTIMAELEPRLLRGLVEAASVLGARAWPLEGLRGLVVEGGAPRRLVIGRLYTGWLPVLAGVVYAAMLHGQKLLLNLVAPEFVGWRWFRQSLALLGIRAEEVLRGTRLVLEDAYPRLTTAQPWRSGAAAVLALLPIARQGGKAELVIDSDEADKLAQLARQLGLSMKARCVGDVCEALLSTGGAEEALSHGEGQWDPDYLYPLVAGTARGGSIRAPYYYVEQPSADSLLHFRDSHIVPAGGVAATPACSGNSPLTCAYLYGLYAYGILDSPPRGLEVLDDRLPGFVSLAQEAGCLL